MALMQPMRRSLYKKLITDKPYFNSVCNLEQVSNALIIKEVYHLHFLLYVIFLK